MRPSRRRATPSSTAFPWRCSGCAGYVGILGSLALRGEFGRVAGFAIALIGFGFSMYLTYRELFTIKAICQWCVSSAVIMTVLAVLTAIRAVRYESAPT